MRANEYEILSRAVSEGIRAGWNRAHKHDDNPSEEAIREKIYYAVMVEICEVFVFDGEKQDEE